MNKSLLVTRPNYDDATSYLFYYAKKVIDFAREKDIKTFDLARPRLTRKNFSSVISKKDPHLVFFNAHGDAKRIYGDKKGKKDEILVEENKNHDLLSNRIVYARACWAAASLGKTCTRRGGCFIGYSAPFSFWTDARWSAKPANDEVAKLFLEPSNLIVISLLKGNTTQEAFDKSVQQSKKNILKILKKEKEPGAMASVMILWNNSKNQQILGNKKMIL